MQADFNAHPYRAHLLQRATKCREERFIPYLKVCALHLTTVPGLRLRSYL